MHIAIVTGGYGGYSGVHTHVRDLSGQLSQHNHIVTIFAPDVKDEDSAEGICFRKINDVRFVPQLLFYFFRLIRRHKEKKIDVVHVFDSIAFLSAYLFRAIYKTPIIFTFQASIFSKGRQIDYSWLMIVILKFTNRFAARHADKVIVVSKEMLECARYAGAKERRLILIHNPIDLAKFYSLRDKKRHQLNQKICLYVGALRPVKGVQYLLEAIPEVLQNTPDTFFMIVGDGPLKGELEQLSSKLNITDSISFRGNLKREDLLEYYNLAEVFIIPSINEPQGIVVLEALACGCPVIGTNVGGIPEMVKNGENGILVPPRDYINLGRAIIRLLSDEKLFKDYSINAINTAKEFSWINNLHKFTNLYEEISNDRELRR